MAVRRFITRMIMVAAMLTAFSNIEAQCTPGWTNTTGTLAVNGDAALEGNCGLEVSFNGTTTKHYVQDDTPNAENVYRVSFLFNPNDVAFNGSTALANQHHIIDVGAVGPDGNEIGFQVLLHNQKTADVLRLKTNGGVDIADDPLRAARKPKPHIVLQSASAPPQTHLIEVEWYSASAPGVRDGLVRIRANGGPWSSVALENYGFGIEVARFGAINGIDATTTGSYFLDDFQSFRTLTE